MRVMVSLLIVALLVVGCSAGSGNKRSQVSALVSNSPKTVNIGYGRVLHYSPVVLSGDIDWSPLNSLAPLLDPSQDFITYNARLEENCAHPSESSVSPISDCYQVLQDQQSSPLASLSGKWAFDPDSQEFLQVHTFYHLKRMILRFQELLAFAYAYTQERSNAQSSYYTAVPPTLYSSQKFWYDEELLVYSNCIVDPEELAFFSPSTFTLCLGGDVDIPGYSAAQDPAIIYHETGHALILTLMNLRNRVAGLSSVTERSNLGVLKFDEANSVNEGLADYIDHMMEGLYHFAYWGIGRFYAQSRPMIETDTLHMSGLSRDADSRLAYPQYLNYDPNDPSYPLEDIHYAGQITSHFLVALSDELKLACSFDHETTSAIIFFALIETLSEVGDLTAKGSSGLTNGEGNNSSDRVNLTALYGLDGRKLSKLWMDMVNPINMRRFFQVFAKYFIKIMNATDPVVSCNGGSSSYGQDEIEKLLDKYGLLLFKTYNDNGSGRTSGHSGTLTAVTPLNRERSVLINKDYLMLEPNVSYPYYIFDNAEQVAENITALKSVGMVMSTTMQIPSTLPYNNDNGSVSPGEIVGIAVRLYNNANWPMAGVQVLANDWDHGKLVDWAPTAENGYDPVAVETGDLKPCRNWGDNFPQESEGAATAATTTAVAGDCEYVSRYNGVHDCDLSTAGECTLALHEMDRSIATPTQELMMPVCMVQYLDNNETIWVSQKRFMESLGMSADECLMPGSPYNCFIRFIPGGDQSWFSKIDPQSTWAATLYPNASPIFLTYHSLFLEANKSIPPGTTFNCRLRARFTNCNDCWHDVSRDDQDDYLDYEYSGGTPFKLLNIQFTVID